jgi:hypothetical protein
MVVIYESRLGEMWYTYEISYLFKIIIVEILKNNTQWVTSNIKFGHQGMSINSIFKNIVSN